VPVKIDNKRVDFVVEEMIFVCAKEMIEKSQVDNAEEGAAVADSARELGLEGE
jgi:hypothetical protein